MTFMFAFFFRSFAGQASNEFRDYRFVFRVTALGCIKLVVVLLNNSVLNVVLQATMVHTIHKGGEESVQSGSFGHSGDELTRHKFSDLHILVYYLILALVTQAAKQLVTLYVGFDNLAVCTEELDLPQFVEN